MAVLPRFSAPLSPQVFQILLSLSDGPAHGYAVIQDIRERTKGEISLTASTLYDALARLVDLSLIVEVDQPPDAKDHDARRRYYRLSALGREAVAQETRRLESLLAMAREKSLGKANGNRGRR
jgi:DNA-binding PadR family transcriptional regulator